MTNKKTLNYFSYFGNDISGMLALGRYLILKAVRGELHSIGVQDSFGLCIFQWLKDHKDFNRAFYMGTRDYDVPAFRARRVYGNKNFFDPVPLDLTNGVQLYSLSGSCRPLCFAELCMYYRISVLFIKFEKVAQQVPNGFSRFLT